MITKMVSEEDFKDLEVKEKNTTNLYSFVAPHQTKSKTKLISSL